MGTAIIKRHLPCLDQDECKSSDAMNIHVGGDAFCWSCHKAFSRKAVEQGGIEIEVEKEEYVKPTSKLTPDDILDNPIRGFKDRRITKEVAEFFGVRCSYGSDGEIDAHYYPYDEGTAWKIRALPKNFTWVGKSEGLFGKDKFSPGGKRLIICEGEIDALSVAQASKDKYGKIYPVIALSTATIAKKSLLKEREWIRTFGEVVLCFDEDDSGREALKEALEIVGYDKAKIVKLPQKDANDVYLHEGKDILMQCIWDAGKYVPSGIISKEALWEALKNYNELPCIPYPPCLAGVNSKLKGMRAGEIALLISGTGSGKSTVLREIGLHLLETAPETKLGIISLEESPPETARKFAGMKLKRNPANEEISIEELKPGFDAVFGDDRVILLDHQGSMNDTSIIGQLEYMCLSGCTHLFIDHITIMVSEGIDNLTGNEAQDKVMNDLLRLVKKYPVWIGLVSHLRKAPSNGKSFEEGKLPSIDDIRGSGSIKQVSFDIISFSRDLTAKDDKKRNNIKMRILKSRHTGLTGTVPGASYSNETGRLTALEKIEDDEEEFTALP